MLTYPRKSESLQQLIYLKRRTVLSEDDEIALYASLQGYQGESEFASVVEQSLQKEYTVLYDIFLKQQNSHFQIDSLIFQEKQLYLLEIKYFHGDYYFQNNHIYHVHSKKRIKNPFDQLQRSELLLRDFLQKHKLPYNIQSYVIFNNPTFTLYQAPIQLNMVLPTQVDRFISKLNKQFSINKPPFQSPLLDIIYSEHIQKNHFEHSPEYHYNDLKKGVFCISCEGIMKLASKYTVTCQKCFKQESIDSAILRTIVEFSALFEKEVITTRYMYEWCGRMFSLRTIRRILEKYLVQQGESRASHYIFHENGQKHK